MLRYAETRHLPSGKGSVVQSWRSTPLLRSSHLVHVVRILAARKSQACL
jgi:hypothetical protein